MNELVCVTPSGDLEIWILKEAYNQDGTPKPAWRFWFWHDDGVFTLNTLMPATPEFWGREVIGDL